MNSSASSFGKKRRVSFFVRDLSSNSIARAVPLAQAIAHKYDVEILGFLIGSGKIHEPHRGLFDYKTIRTSRRSSELFRNIPRLASMATGDIIYGCKPLMTSFAPALYAARFIQHRPLFLDVEDSDWPPDGVTPLEFVWLHLLRGWRLGTSWKYTALLHLLTRWADDVTVVSRSLQERYGGVLLRHGPDEREFDPSRFEGAQSSLRQRWDLPQNRRLALFPGTPRSHKGLEVLTEALTRPEAQSWDLVLLGSEDNPVNQKIAATLGSRCHLLGYRPYAEVPELLALADAVPIPQRRVPYAESQVPAKLLDALAMSCPIIASRIGDLPKILGEGRRGWLVEPERPEALAAALAGVEKHPDAARRRSQAGREWYLKNASSSAIFSTLDTMFTAAVS